MGRGKSFSKADQAHLAQCFADGESVQQVAKDKGWLTRSVRRAFVRLAAGEPVTKFRGSPLGAKTTPDRIEAAKTLMDSAKEDISISRMAAHLHVKRSTARRILAEAGGTPYKKEKRLGLKTEHRTKRKMFCRQFLRTLRVLPMPRRTDKSPDIPAVPIADMVWEDEKMFRLETTASAQNHRLWSTAKNKASAFSKAPELSKLPSAKRMCQGIMAAGIVGVGFRHMVFVEEKAKINTVSWLHLMETMLVPYVPPNRLMVMDNAPSHCSKAAVADYKAKGVKYMFQSPNSPDLNVLDFFVWARTEMLMLQENPPGSSTPWQSCEEQL